MRKCYPVSQLQKRSRMMGFLDGTQRGMTTMPTYIHLANYTQEGIENIGNHEPQPEDVIDSLGAGELKSLYFTLGQYDVVALTEFPDDETATKFSIRMSQGGHSKAETLRAFTEEQSLEIIEGLPE